MSRPAAREVKTASASKAVVGTMTRKATRGVKAGLNPDESRVTCILKDEQNQILHDWARTTEQSFKEVCLAMAETYIQTVIAAAAADGAKVKRSVRKDPPAQYADLYEDETPNLYAKYIRTTE